MVGVVPTRFLGGLLPGHWMVPFGQDCPLAVPKGSWNQAPWLFQVLQPSLRYADLDLEARIGMSLTRSPGGLDFSLPMTGGAAAAEDRTLSGSPEV